jgi:geranylgeranyl diphosphate synthase type I
MQLLDEQLSRSLRALDGPSELMDRMARYSLGMVNIQGEPTDDDIRKQVQGKRLRPQIAMLVAEAVGGSSAAAAPVAAAIELLHNFTLIHDDIQDRSPNRRHRPTVWRVWSDAQAINAGDALFAVSQLSLLDAAGHVPCETMQSLIVEFNRCTIDIVRGQVQDLNNEGRADVTPDDYLEMIRGKTGAILRYSAWAGAMVGGADRATADRIGEIGQSIGTGFQIRDDMLGIWSPAAETGKGTADDLRRRKQSLPVLILRAAAGEEDATRIQHIYATEEIEEEHIEELLQLLEKYDVEARTAAHVSAGHTSALAILDDVFGNNSSPAVAELRELVTQLVHRSF